MLNDNKTELAWRDDGRLDDSLIDPEMISCPLSTSTSALLQGVLVLLQGHTMQGHQDHRDTTTLGLQRTENASFVVMFDHFSFHIASCTSQDICRVTRSPEHQGTPAHVADHQGTRCRDSVSTPLSAETGSNTALEFLFLKLWNTVCITHRRTDSSAGQNILI